METLFCLQINLQSLWPMEVLGTESTQQIPNESINADANKWVLSIFGNFKTNQFQHFPVFVTNHTNQNLFVQTTKLVCSKRF